MKFNQVLVVILLASASTVWTVVEGQRAVEAEDRYSRDVQVTDPKLKEVEQRREAAKKAAIEKQEADRKAQEAQRARDKELFTDTGTAQGGLDLFGQDSQSTASAPQPSGARAASAPTQAQAGVADSGVLFGGDDFDILGDRQRARVAADRNARSDGEGYWLGDEPTVQPQATASEQSKPRFSDFIDTDAPRITSDDLNQQTESKLPPTVQPLEMGDQNVSSRTKALTGPGRRPAVRPEVKAPVDPIAQLEVQNENLRSQLQNARTPLEISTIHQQMFEVAKDLSKRTNNSQYLLDYVDQTQRDAVSLDISTQSRLFRQVTRVYDLLSEKSSDPSQKAEYKQKANDAWKLAQSAAQEAGVTLEPRSESVSVWNRITSGEAFLQFRKWLTRPTDHKTLADFNEQLSKINKELGDHEASLKFASEAVRNRLQQMLKDPTARLQKVLADHQSGAQHVVTLDPKTMTVEEKQALAQYQASAAALELFTQTVQEAQAKAQGDVSRLDTASLRSSLKNAFDAIEQQFKTDANFSIDLTAQSEWNTLRSQLVTTVDSLATQKVQRDNMSKQVDEQDQEDALSGAGDLFNTATDNYEEAQYQENVKKGKEALLFGTTDELNEIRNALPEGERAQFDRDIRKDKISTILAKRFQDVRNYVSKIFTKAEPMPVVASTEPAAVKKWGIDLSSWFTKAVADPKLTGPQKRDAVRAVDQTVQAVQAEVSDQPTKSVLQQLRDALNRVTGKTAAQRRGIGAVPSADGTATRDRAMGRMPSGETDLGEMQMTENPLFADRKLQAGTDNNVTSTLNTERNALDQNEYQPEFSAVDQTRLDDFLNEDEPSTPVKKAAPMSADEEDMYSGAQRRLGVQEGSITKEQRAKLPKTVKRERVKRGSRGERVDTDSTLSRTGSVDSVASDPTVAGESEVAQAGTDSAIATQSEPERMTPDRANKLSTDALLASRKAQSIPTIENHNVAREANRKAAVAQRMIGDSDFADEHGKLVDEHEYQADKMQKTDDAIQASENARFNPTVQNHNAAATKHYRAALIRAQNLDTNSYDSHMKLGEYHEQQASVLADRAKSALLAGQNESGGVAQPSRV